MREMTVCFLIHHSGGKKVLLGDKKAGFGAGKHAGIGGKVERGETVENASFTEPLMHEPSVGGVYEQR